MSYICDFREACGSGNGYSFTGTLPTMEPFNMTLHKVSTFQSFRVG
jgi:hypothetical protein